MLILHADNVVPQKVQYRLIPSYTKRNLRESRRIVSSFYADESEAGQMQPPMIETDGDGWIRLFVCIGQSGKARMPLALRKKIPTGISDRNRRD